MKKIIYLDLDDTVKDTEKYIRRVLRSNGLTEPKGTVYNWIGTDKEDIVREVLCNHDAIPYKDGAENSIYLLSTEYEIIYCSAYRYEREAKAKRAFAEKQGREIILCNKFYDKSHVDMSGCIFVDDRPDTVLLSNAERKYEMLNQYTYNVLDVRDPNAKIVDWYSLVEDILGGIPINENAGRVIYTGIQGRYSYYRQ